MLPADAGPPKQPVLQPVGGGDLGSLICVKVHSFPYLGLVVAAQRGLLRFALAKLLEQIDVVMRCGIGSRNRARFSCWTQSTHTSPILLLTHSTLSCWLTLVSRSQQGYCCMQGSCDLPASAPAVHAFACCWRIFFNCYKAVAAGRGLVPSTI